MFSFSYLISLAFLLINPKEECLIITKQEFVINGETSIGKFKCTYDDTQKDTLYWKSSSKDRKIKYAIPGKEFGCGNFLLNGDFRKTLKVKEYPQTQLEISNIKKKTNSFTCDVLLHLAGKQKSYKGIELLKTNKGVIGSFTVNFNDFNLQAPQKMSGMIKVKDQVDLSIVLNIQ
jgi:hypothetical protein